MLFSYEGDVWNPYNDTVEAREVEEIEVTEQPRLEYDSGENLDLSGMNITEYYTDDTTKNVTFGDIDWDEYYMAEPENGTELNEENHGDTITVTHTDLQETAKTNPLTIHRVLDDIEVTEQPKLEYYVGETLDLTEMEITEYYTDDSTEIVTFGDAEWEENYTADPEDGINVNETHHGHTINVIHENEFLTAETDELTVNHELTIDIEGQGSTDPDEGTHSYGHGTDVTVQAIEDVDGWKFVNWTGDYEGTEDTITITMDEDKSLTAHFLEEAFFEVEIVDYDEEVIEGEEFTVNYTVTNTGEITDTQDIQFTVYDKFGDVVYSDYVEPTELKGEEVHEDSFIWETEDEEELEDFSFKIETEDDKEEREFLVFEEPYFRVTINEPEDGYDSLEEEFVTVEYTIDNLGGIDDTQDIRFYVGYNRIDVEESLELEGGDNYTGTFEWIAEEPYGERDLTVVSDDDHESVTVIVLEEAYFEVEIIEPVDGEEFYEGQTVSVEYTVKNTGDRTDTQNINFSIDGDMIQTEEELKLEGGRVHEGEFIWIAEEPYGERNVMVESEDDQEHLTIIVEERPEEAFFDVHISTPEMKSEYNESETVIVEYEIKNLGEETDTQDINFYIDDDLNDTRENLELEGGESDTGTFEWTAEEPFGDRELTIQSEDYSDSITIVVLEDAFFEVEIIEPVDGEEFYEGQTVSVEYTVKNTGDRTDTQEITFSIDETVEDSVEITLDGGETYSGEFTWTSEGIDVELNLVVESVDDEDSITITVKEPPEEAFFDIYISAPEKNSEYFEGDTVTVEYEVKNLGEESDTQDINFYIDDDLLATEEDVTIEEDGIYEGEFTWTAEEPFGDRELTIQSEDYSDSVTITVPYFKVEILQPREDQRYIEGEPVTVRFTVENTGSTTVTQDINFTIDGVRVDIERNVGLEGGEIYEGSSQWISEDPYGERELKVQSENHHDEVMIIVLEDPYFEVSLIEPMEGEVYIEGEDVTIDFYVENIGYVVGNQDIEVSIDGEPIEIIEEVELDGGSTYSRKFTWTAEEPYGERELLVKSEDDSNSITITVLKDAFFEVEIIDYEDVVEGEEFSVSFEVENTGEVIGTQDIHYTIYDDTDDEIYSITVEDVELDEGEIFDEEFSWSSEEPGEYYLTVTSEDDEKEVEFRVLQEAFFEITINSPGSGEEFVEGEEISVNYTVTNTGEVEDTQTIEFTINGELEESLEVTLDEEEIFQSEFIWTPEESGEYELRIASEADNHQEGILSVEVGTPPSNYLPYLLLLIAAIAVSIGFIIYKTHLAKKEPVIEELFLISKRNSMLILHNTRRLRPDRDSDIIAGMFEAVQNFIEDSFQDTGDWQLNRLEFGGNNIVIEQGEHIYMAVVYEGELGEKKIQEIREVIEKIENEFGEQLKEWDGDRKELRGIKDMTQDIFS